MSNTKNAYLALSEELGLAPAQLQKQINEEDEEWKEHITAHNGHPSANCHYCTANADGEEMLEEEEYD